MTRYLRHPTTWAAVAVAALIGSVMTFSYIGGFVDPAGNLHDAPIAFVDDDAGATVAGTRIELGQQIQQELAASSGPEIDWQVLDSRDEAERRLRDNELWGAIVVPESFSSDVARIAATAGAAPRAELDVLTNEGTGIFQPTIVTEIRDRLVETTSTEVNQQLVTLLEQAQTTVTPDAAVALGDPVAADTTAVVELPDRAGRGIAPFYLAVMVTLTGFLAASIVSVTMDIQRGAERLELLGRPIPFRLGDTGPWHLWLLKAPLTVLAAALGGIVVVMTALVPLGMSVSSAPAAYGTGVLGAVTIGLISLVLITLFGIAGELLGVLFTTIFGVPSALGVYPGEAVPALFRFIAAWHPLRYLTDSLRSIAFFDASGAGLGRGITVLAIWLVGAAVAGTLVARLLHDPLRSGPEDPARGARP